MNLTEQEAAANWPKPTTLKPARRRVSARDAIRARLDGMAGHVPPPDTDRETGCLRGPISGAPVETIGHQYDVAGAHQRYANRYRRVLAARRDPSLYGWRQIFEPHMLVGCGCPKCRHDRGQIVREFTSTAPSWWYLGGAVIGEAARRAIEEAGS
jgi:hypothetical protein